MSCLNCRPGYECGIHNHSFHPDDYKYRGALKGWLYVVAGFLAYAWLYPFIVHLIARSF